MASFDDYSGCACSGNKPLHLHIFKELLYMSCYEIRELSFLNNYNSLSF